MAVNLLVNGVNYTYPTLTDEGWGPDASNWALAITQGTLQKAAGLFALTQDVDFGPTGGLKSIYYKSRSANIASAGQIRLSNTDTIDFRNSANSGNITLGTGSSDLIPAWGGVDLFTSLNSLTGAVTLAAGTNVTLVPVGNTITINSTASGGGSPGGASGQLQYNNAGSFGGTTGITFTGGNLNLSSHSITAGGVFLTGFTPAVLEAGPGFIQINANNGSPVPLIIQASEFDISAPTFFSDDATFLGNKKALFSSTTASPAYDAEIFMDGSFLAINAVGGTLNGQIQMASGQLIDINSPGIIFHDGLTPGVPTLYFSGGILNLNNGTGTGGGTLNADNGSLINISVSNFINRTTPATPAAGKVTLFVDTADKHTKQIDDTGTVIDLASGGSGVINEFAYNTGIVTAAGGSDLTSFANGPAGTAILAYDSTTSSSQTTFRVRFLNPFVDTDMITIEILEPSSNIWLDATTIGINFVFQGAVYYGVHMTPVASNTTDIDVEFGNGGYGPVDPTYATPAGNPSGWGVLTGWNWRIRKTSF